MREIPLTKGQVALVDDADFHYLNQWKWYAAWNRTSNTYYAQRTTTRGDGSRTTLMMHKELTGYDKTDHKDHNGLNNQRSNLRQSTTTQNGQNRQSRAGKSRYKGVTWYARNESWIAQIVVAGKKRYLGSFSIEKDAARAYNEAAMQYFFGEFALLNDLSEEET